MLSCSTSLSRQWIGGESTELCCWTDVGGPDVSTANGCLDTCSRVVELTTVYKDGFLSPMCSRSSPNSPLLLHPRQHPTFGRQGNDEDEGGFGGPILGGEDLTASSDMPIDHGANRTTTTGGQGIRGVFSNAKSASGNFFSKAAAKTSQAVSNATTVTRKAVTESGHRIRDIQNQHEDELNRGATTSTIRANPGNGMVNTTTYARGTNHLLPGRRTDSQSHVQKTVTGGTQQTTTVSTSRASGGFMPYLPGTTRTTETVTRDDQRGNSTAVQQQTSVGGGRLTIIPLGPTGGVGRCGSSGGQECLRSPTKSTTTT